MADVQVVAYEQELLAKVDGRIREVVPLLIPAVVRVVDVPLVIGTRGVVLAVNDNIFFRLGLNGTVRILTWSLAGTITGASASGTIRVDVLSGSTLATVASICGGTGNQPQLSAAAEASDQLPSGWTLDLTDPQWIMARVASTGGTLEVASLTLRCVVVS